VGRARSRDVEGCHRQASGLSSKPTEPWPERAEAALGCQEQEIGETGGLSGTVKLKELDIDRVFVDAAMAEIHRLNGCGQTGAANRGLGFQSNNKAFRQFVDSVP